MADWSLPNQRSCHRRTRADYSTSMCKFDDRNYREYFPYFPSLLIIEINLLGRVFIWRRENIRKQRYLECESWKLTERELKSKAHTRHNVREKIYRLKMFFFFLGDVWAEASVSLLAAGSVVVTSLHTGEWARLCDIICCCRSQVGVLQLCSIECLVWLVVVVFVHGSGENWKNVCLINFHSRLFFFISHVLMLRICAIYFCFQFQFTNK